MASRPLRPRVVNGPLIKPREPGRFRDLGRVVLLGALVALPAFLYAGLQARLLEHRRTVVRLEQRLEELREQRRRLDVELASLADPHRIERIARTQALEPRRQDQTIHLTPRPLVLDAPPPLVAEVKGGDDGRQRR